MKGPWENRVGMLLSDPQNFRWSHKCPDVGPHGGETKLDWIACSWSGRFWMIEVKWSQAVGTQFHNYDEVTSGQRKALSEVAPCAPSLLAVGHGKTANEHRKYITGLYLFNWRDIADKENFDMLEEPHLFIPWKGETQFKTHEHSSQLWSFGRWPQ